MTGQLAGDRHHGDAGRLAAGGHLGILSVQPLLRLPGPGQRLRRQAGLPAPEGGPDRGPVPVGPRRLDQGGAHPFRAGLGDVAPAGAGPAGVFRRDQPGEAHERAGGGEPAPVHHLGRQGEAGQPGDPPVAAQPGHRAGQRLPARPRGQPGLGRGQLGLPRFQATAVQREGLGQRRLIEDLPVQPRPVRVTLVLAATPDPAMTQQHRVQPLLHPLAVIEQVPRARTRSRTASSAGDGTRTGVSSPAR